MTEQTTRSQTGNFLRTLKERERELEDLKAEFEVLRKISSYARQEFHLMTELFP